MGIDETPAVLHTYTNRGCLHTGPGTQHSEKPQAKDVRIRGKTPNTVCVNEYDLRNGRRKVNRYVSWNSTTIALSLLMSNPIEMNGGNGAVSADLPTGVRRTVNEGCPSRWCQTTTNRITQCIGEH